MIVMKFGGTSVEDAAAMRRVIGTIKREAGRKPLVVLSACAGVTNELIRAASTVSAGERDKSLAILDRLRTRHRAIAEELLSPDARATIAEPMDEMFQDLRNFVRGVHLLGELTRRSLDGFACYGERLSSLILHAAVVDSGLPATLIDAGSVMVTDDSFMSAQPLLDEIACKAREQIVPALETTGIAITQGFIGATKSGVPTTIGRGGSDYSASLFGSVLGAEEIQIWTDVDGMMSADPRVVADARPLESLTFEEASELAYFGAKVLHPNTILPAIRSRIPVRVLNSKKPEKSGTLIIPCSAESRSESVVKSIAMKRGISVVNISSSRMLMAHGFLSRLFSIFAEYKKSIDVVATSEVSVSLTVDTVDGLDEMRPALATIGEIRIVHQKAIVCVVGEGMKHTPGIAARIFGALARERVNIEMVSEGASEINLTIVVDEADVERAVRALHGEFFGEKG